MKYRKLIAAIFVVLMSTTSLSMLAAAQESEKKWLAGGGAFEPSMPEYDTKAYMFQNPNNQSIEKIYFNSYFVHYAGYIAAGHFYDANLDGGNVFSPWTNFAVAVLGYWRDCNDDGYIGAKNAPSSYGSFTTYPTSLDGVAYNINTTRCPVGSPYYPLNPATGQPNGFVDEFRQIGPDAGCDAWKAGCPGSPSETPTRLCVPPSNPNSPVCVEGLRAPSNDHFDVTDNKSRVWGDWERPGGMHVPYGALTPLPRGTFEDTHGTLRFVDDATLNTISDTVDLFGTVPNVGGCDDWTHPTALTGPMGTCGLYPLWQVRRVVNDTTCESEQSSSVGAGPGCSEPDPMVTVFEMETDDDGTGTPCDDQAYQTVPNPQDNSVLVRVALPNVQPGYNPNVLTDGSISGTLEHIERGTNATTVFPGSNDQGNGKCGEDGGLADPIFETDGSDSQRKHSEPSMVFNYTADFRTHTLTTAGFYNAPVNEYANLGHQPHGTYRGNLVMPTAGWTTNVLWTSRPPRHGWGYVTPTYSTVYADVSSEAFIGDGTEKGPKGNSLANPAVALPAGRQDAHVYGSDFCPAFTIGPENLNPANNWDCSITQWENTRLNYDVTDRERYGAIIGDPYDFRDVDCYDNTISTMTGDAQLGIAARCVPAS